MNKIRMELINPSHKQGAVTEINQSVKGIEREAQRIEKKSVRNCFRCI